MITVLFFNKSGSNILPPGFEVLNYQENTVMKD